MFERFTEGARDATIAARDAARIAGHSWVGPEHLVYGLVKQEDRSIAARALEAVGISTTTAWYAIMRIPAPKEVVVAEPAFTDGAKKAFEMALREALSLGHNYIGQEHVLLGLLRVEKAKQELTARTGALGGQSRRDAIHDEVMRLLGASRRSEEAPVVCDCGQLAGEEHSAECAVVKAGLAPSPSPGIAFDAAEQAISDHILAAMRGIHDLGLRANKTELAMHVHGMQRFVIQHMLQRVGGEWGEWYA